MPQYSQAHKRELTLKAIELRAERYSYSAIARELCLSHPTVKKWIEGYFIEQSETRYVSDARELAIATYAAGIRDCWERLRALPIDSRATNVGALHNNIRSYQERIDKLTGAEAPIKYQEVEDEIVISWPDADDAELLAITESQESSQAADSDSL